MPLGRSIALRSCRCWQCAGHRTFAGQILLGHVYDLCVGEFLQPHLAVSPTMSGAVCRRASRWSEAIWILDAAASLRG
jgi:hypothetical protein